MTRWILTVLLILQELSLNLWYFKLDTWDISTSLPLHVRGAAIVLAAVLLIKQNRVVYELVYFWGLEGAIQALITPDIGPWV